MDVIVVPTWFITTILALWFVRCCVDAWLLILRNRIDSQQQQIIRYFEAIEADRKGGAT